MSQAGHIISLDLSLGNKKYLECGLSVLTLFAFDTFYKNIVDNKADIFLFPIKITPCMFYSQNNSV